MSKDYDVLVIGAGIGGLSCAALLSHAGFKTMVLEKNKIIGGRCVSYKKDDCIIDTFIHMFASCEKGPFGEILRCTEMPDAIKFWHVDPSNKPLLFQNGKPYVYPDLSFATDEDMKETFKGLLMPDKDYEAALRMNDDIYGMSEEKTHELDNVTYFDWMANYSTHDALKGMHSFRAMLMGVVGLYEASAGEVIRMTRNWHLKRNLGYPLGGCQAIPDGFAKIIRRYGGEIRTGIRVDQIMLSQGRATGVRLKNGEEINARAVVSNMGLKETVQNLIREDALSGEYSNYVQNLSCGMFGTDEFMDMFLNIKVLLDEPVVKSPVVFTAPLAAGEEKLMEMMSQVASGEIPDSFDAISLFMPIPSNMDPSLVPPGRQLLNFPGFAPPGEKDLGRWVDMQLDFLETLYPGVKEHVLWWDVIKGSAVKGYSGRFQSDIIGLGQIVGQVGKDRPAIESPLKGLFHVGADVGQDNIGTELAAESAVRAAPIVQDYLGLIKETTPVPQ